jgi:hypothetical protein
MCGVRLQVAGIRSCNPPLSHGGEPSDTGLHAFNPIIVVFSDGGQWQNFSHIKLRSVLPDRGLKVSSPLRPSYISLPQLCGQDGPWPQPLVDGYTNN